KNIRENQKEEEEEEHQSKYVLLLDRFISYIAECGWLGPIYKPNETYFPVVLLRAWFASSRVLYEYKWTLSTFTDVLRQVEDMYHQGFICPGEAVGMHAGQSIGEVSTQCTLSKFKTPGV